MARARKRGALHGRTADAGHGATRRRARQAGEDNAERSQGALSLGQGEPAVPGAAAECAVGVRLHLCRHMAGLRLCGLRDRRLRSADRRLARRTHGACGFVLDALEQALLERRPVHGGGLVHHSDRGVQYVSIKYTQRLAEAGVEPSVGSVGIIAESVP